MQAGLYPDVPPDFGHWLAGFIDGEGSFIIVRNETSWAPRFALKLRDDDRAITAEIHKVTGVGRLYRRRIMKSDIPGANPQSVWVVVSKADTQQLARLLDAYPLRTKKMLAYSLWREAVLYRATLRARGPRTHDWGPIPALAQELRELYLYGGTDSAN